MALYFYKALSKAGKLVSGTFDASSDAAVRTELTSKGLYAVHVELQANRSSLALFFSQLFQSSVSFKDVIFFTKQLSVLLKAGVPLLQALELLADNFTGKLRSIIIALKDNIKEGKSLADGLESYPQVFNTIYIQLVRAGEASGKLEVILERLVEYLERRQEISAKIGKALFMPAMQLTIMLLAVIAIMVMVVPQLTGILEQSGKEIPGATKIIMSISDLFVYHYLALGIGFGLFLITIAYILSTPWGKIKFDTLKLHIPLVSYFARTGAVVQFCSTLGMLEESGVSLSSALEIVDKIIDNAILQATLREAKEKIIKQGKITPFLKETNIFPSIAIYLIKTGEESGQLGFMLNTVAINYEKDLSEFTDALTASIEPAITIVFGCIIGFILMAVLGPIMTMQNV